MNARRFFVGFCLSLFCLAAASPAFALANRVFVSQRSGNDANSCDNILTPCRTFAGAVLQLNPGGEAIVLDSGGYGPVTITQAVTIEAPPGVTAFIHPPSGDAITVTAGSGTVTLRGLVLNGGAGEGINVTAVGTLNVENCLITGFVGDGILMNSTGRLNLKGTDIEATANGVLVTTASGLVQASVDHCHFDGNGNGYITASAAPGRSTTTATNSTANGNAQDGWHSSDNTSGIDDLHLEFCSGSENGGNGLYCNSASPSSFVTFSNCVFARNGDASVNNAGSGTALSRGNNTILGSPNGPISSFAPF